MIDMKVNDKFVLETLEDIYSRCNEAHRITTDVMVDIYVTRAMEQINLLHKLLSLSTE